MNFPVKFKCYVCRHCSNLVCTVRRRGLGWQNFQGVPYPVEVGKTAPPEGAKINDEC